MIKPPTISLPLLALLGVACDDGSGSVDRTSQLPESLLEQGWYIDDDGDLVREREDGTIEHALPEGDLASAPDEHDARGAADELAAPADPAAVTYGVWTAMPWAESCHDLFGQACSLTVPSNQCDAGSTCIWSPGTSCFDVQSAWSVKVLYCKK